MCKLHVSEASRTDRRLTCSASPSINSGTDVPGHGFWTFMTSMPTAAEPGSSPGSSEQTDARATRSWSCETLKSKVDCWKTRLCCRASKVSHCVHVVAESLGASYQGRATAVRPVKGETAPVFSQSRACDVPRQKSAEQRPYRWRQYLVRSGGYLCICERDTHAGRLAGSETWQPHCAIRRRRNGATVRASRAGRRRLPVGLKGRPPRPG